MINVKKEVMKAMESHGDQSEAVMAFFLRYRYKETSFFSLPGYDDIRIPGKWLHADVSDIIANRITFYTEEDVISLYEGSFRKDLSFKPPIGSTDRKALRDYAFSVFVRMADSKRTNFSKILSCLIDNPTYIVSVNSMTGEGITSEGLVRHVRPINIDHAASGFVETHMDDNLWAINKDEGDSKGPMIVSGHNIKKVSQRITKLLPGPDSIYIGNYKVFVARDIGRCAPNLLPLFNTGAIYTPRSLMERDGVMRLMSPVGVKAATIPLTNSMHSFKPEVFIASASCFKGGLNGVYKQLSGDSYREVMNVDVEKFKRIMVDNLSAMDIHGTTVSGWYIDVPMYCTNFYVLYGLFKKHDEDEFVDPDTPEGSFYNDVLDKKRIDPTYSVVKAVRSSCMLNRYPKLKVKALEVRNIAFGYSNEVSINVAKAVVKMSLEGYEGVSYLEGCQKEGLDLITGGVLKRTGRDPIDLPLFRDLSFALFPKMVPTSLDLNIPEHRVFIDGGEVNGINWGGLRHTEAMRLVVDSKHDDISLYIPSGETLSKYVFEQEGSSEVYLTGPAKSLLLLLIAAKSRKTNWAVKAFQYHTELQNYMLNSNIDNWTVKGSGSKVILPGFWLNYDSIVCTDTRFKEWDKKEVMYSKMPVIHHQAAGGYNFSNSLPENLYSNISPALKYALRDAIFVSPDSLLDRQDDCDGDMGRITYVGGKEVLPLVTKLPKHMKAWSDKYKAGENDMKLKWSTPTVCSGGDMNNATLEILKSRTLIGGGSNSLFLLETALETLVNKGHFAPASAILIRNYYSMLFQDSVIRNVKYMGQGVDFNKVLMRRMLLIGQGSINESDPREASRVSRKDLINLFKGEITNELEMFFALWDKFSGVAEIGLTSLAYRRINSIEQVSCIPECPLEPYMMMIDAITNSYHYGLMSVFSAPNSYMLIKKSGFDEYLEDNYKEVRYRYIFIGNNLSRNGITTTLGKFLTAYVELR